MTSGVTSMLTCPGCIIMSRAPSPSIRLILWAGVVLDGIVLKRWLRGRDLNPQRRGYESRLEPFLPAIC